MLLPPFLTRRNGCIVTDGVQRHPYFAFFQQLQGLFPALALRTCTDGCIVAGRVRPNPIIAHDLQKSKRMLPFTSCFAGTDGSTVGDDIGAHLAPARCKYVQRLNPLSLSAMLCECLT